MRTVSVVMRRERDICPGRRHRIKEGPQKLSHRLVHAKPDGRAVGSVQDVGRGRVGHACA
ncbi:hypothetical protein C7S16_6377 [Burkholderia thailandensis]|uniref:Uncharacterized protein n=1 Tax=Burkholderia thailandensis TaxID=57975 RepID=A0AAW9CUS7_BURTH|nr:hypothetical protein [Burkholderia thailandensis]MDW9252768.1 hypothetical protein [Burkholderia thailandensis]